jgi:Domain of unknown function (DUF4253)
MARSQFDIRPAGALFQFPRYEWTQPKGGLVPRVLRAMGLAKARRRVARPEEVASPFAFALLRGHEAEGALDELARLRPDCTPVILGSPESAADMLDIGERTSPDALLAELDRLDPVGWIAERLAAFKQRSKPARGAWPVSNRVIRPGGLDSVRSARKPQDFLPEVIVVLVPVAEPALLALHLGYGDWNDCPSPVVHAAMARRWSTQYGAVPVALAGDVVEYRVARPVDTREQAIALALEHFAYCPDAILQGAETVERLAAELLGLRYWLFWWD